MNIRDIAIGAAAASTITVGVMSIDGNEPVPPAAPVTCPAGWVETQGTEPDSGMFFVVCETDRFILTIREDGRLAAQDKITGQSVDAEQFLP